MVLSIRHFYRPLILCLKACEFKINKIDFKHFSFYADGKNVIRGNGETRSCNGHE
jgi:hypothetical protein